MKSEIVTMDEFLVVGIGMDCESNDISSVGLLWDKFLLRIDEIPDSLGIYGVCSYLDVEGNYYYMVGCRVANKVEVPEGMELWKVVGHKYLVSRFNGLPEKMGKKWADVVKSLSPKGGVVVRPDGPWLEIYSDNYFDAETGKITCDLYTPVGE